MERAIKKPRIPEKFLGAFKEGHIFQHKEFIDHDYTHALLKKAEAGDEEAIKALQWLTDFNNEHYKCVFKRDGTDLHTPDEIPERDHAKYASRNDVFNYRVKEGEVPNPSALGEDDLIALIDFIKEKNKSRHQ